MAVALVACGPKGLKVPELGPVPALPEWPLDPPTPEKVARHTPSLLNLVYAPVFRWDGAMDSLVEVMALPFGEANMNLGKDLPESQAALAQRLTQAAPECTSARPRWGPTRTTTRSSTSRCR